MILPETSLPPLRCPVCSAALNYAVDTEKQLLCHQGHSFDRAKQGYWNLLLPQRKRSKAPGDNEAMVQARHRFLSQGYYQPIASEIQASLMNLLDQNQLPLLLDLGCGEGYYTQQLFHTLTSKHQNALCVGLDISKPAILHASKQSKQITWMVATGADIPLQAESVDIATLIFARLLPEPTAQVLKRGGYFIVAWAGPDHLRELREQIYTEVRDSDLNPDAQLIALFEPIETKVVKFQFTLSDQQSMDDLLMMTPHGQRLTHEAREKLLLLPTLTLQADIRLSIYRKR